MLDDDGENYNTWYTALQLALNNRGIWPIVTGTELARIGRLTLLATKSGASRIAKLDL